MKRGRVASGGRSVTRSIGRHAAVAVEAERGKREPAAGDARLPIIPSLPNLDHPRKKRGSEFLVSFFYFFLHETREPTTTTTTARHPHTHTRTSRPPPSADRVRTSRHVLGRASTAVFFSASHVSVLVPNTHLKSPTQYTTNLAPTRGTRTSGRDDETAALLRRERGQQRHGPRPGRIRSPPASKRAARKEDKSGRGADRGGRMDRSWAACMTIWPRSYYSDRAGRASEYCSLLTTPAGRGEVGLDHGLTGGLTTRRSCLLHRFVKNEWRVLSSQTIGVEFATKIIKVGTGARRKRIKLQVRSTQPTPQRSPTISVANMARPNSSGIPPAQNDSGPSHDPTTAAPRAPSSSTTSPPIPPSTPYNPS